MQQYTPMMQQYLSIKANYKDAFLFFRLGDFYEMFFEDAIKASQELEITLTSRGGDGDRIPMCGVPHHAAAGYIETLVGRGYKVAVCEQVEDPKATKGVVKREVVQLITPGTLMEGKGISDKQNHYIASMSTGEGAYGIAMVDITTGESTVTTITGSVQEAMLFIVDSGAKELVLSSDTVLEEIQEIARQYGITLSFEEETSIVPAFEKTVTSLQEQGDRDVYGRLLHYLIRTQKRSLDHLQEVKKIYRNRFMKMDIHSKRNLELVETIRSKDRTGSLVWLLDGTKTAMGARLLKQWIDRPLVIQEEIEQRHGMVETFMNDFFAREEIKESLKEVYDLERLAGKIAFGNVNARDLIQLKRSLFQVPAIKEKVMSLNNEYAITLGNQMDTCEEVATLLERSIKEEPPLSIKDGDIIKDGYSAELDRYRDASKNGKTWIADLERREREKTGIKSLKIGYNRIFGYYIEVTRANLQFLPEGMYERKQTLANAERFITDELKEKEALILEAEEKIVALEYDLFVNIREEVKTFIPRLQALAKIISELDIYQSFATISEQYHYIKPVMTTNRQLMIKDGRHPVVEKVLGNNTYVPNDCMMDEDLNILLITGPNMSGKSTYMRQLALIAVMAQIGCFIPAEEATLPIFDQIFTRIGAADDLISGQSTFMVEMLEANNAITHATKNSLILFDEIGRGTSTYDGMALAQAIIEYIHHRIGAKTLFSTHYHELTDLEDHLVHLKNVHVTAVEEKGKVVFLHKIQHGAADKSYGIHVAQLANLPAELINRAQEVLTQLEGIEKEKEITITPSPIATPLPKEERKPVVEDDQLSFFVETVKEDKGPEFTSKEKDVVAKIKKLDILDMTPLQAMNELYALQKQLKKKK
ncbi:MAG: DNA mismatch repair protein MutS [Bacillaceae bacterium]